MHKYQVRAVQHGLEHPLASYWLDMGLGKTIIALSVIQERMSRCEVTGTLIVAPLRVCQTVWAQEARKWTHTKDLSFNLIHGNRAQRSRAALTPANIYLVNYENLVWLIEFLIEQRISKGLYPPFNMMVFDESTKLKAVDTKRHKALRKILCYLPFRLALTGTPASNGYMDLFGQYLAIDSGDRLGQRITHFRNTYFSNDGYSYKWHLKPGADKLIQDSIADITLEMKAADYLELPKVVFNNIMVDLPAKALKHYADLERDMFTVLDNGQGIESANAAVLTNKCLQAANGAIYDEDRNWHKLHDAKLDALEDIVEESAGQPLLVLYGFKHDQARIKEKFPGAVDFHDYKDPQQLMDDWDKGLIQMLIGHPASMGHGLNLQYGGHIIVWFGLNWSLDLYLQANARLDRQGQKRPVMIHRILANDTMDFAVLEALENKATTQEQLRDAIKKYRNR